MGWPTIVHTQAIKEGCHVGRLYQLLLYDPTEPSATVFEHDMSAAGPEFAKLSSASARPLGPKEELRDGRRKLRRNHLSN